MSKHNYSQYSNKNRENKPKQYDNQPKQMIENPVPEVKMEEVTPMIDIVVEPVAEPANLPKTVAGVVTNCAKLNVRSKPSITGEVLCVLNASSEIEVDYEKSVPDWAYVCTATGVEGYCMRQFIKADM